MIMYFKYTFFVDVSLVLLIYTDINFRKVLSSLHVIWFRKCCYFILFFGEIFPCLFFFLGNKFNLRQLCYSLSFLVPKEKQSAVCFIFLISYTFWLKFHNFQQKITCSCILENGSIFITVRYQQCHCIITSVISVCCSCINFYIQWKVA